VFKLHVRQLNDSILRAFLAVFWLVWMASFVRPGVGQEPTKEPEQTSVLVEIQLPIQNNNIGSITRALNAAVANAENASTDNQRPFLIVRFLPAEQASEISSDFGACNTLESFLSSTELTQRCRTVAVLDGHYADHALLAALACSKLIVSPETILAGSEKDTTRLSAEIRDDYRRVTDSKKHLPYAVIQAMLDPAVPLHEVQTSDSTYFATGAERQTLIDQGQLTSSTGISMAGDAFQIDRTVLTRLSAISMMPTNDTTLAAELSIPPTRFLKSSAPVGEIHAVVIDMSQLIGISRVRDKQVLINQLAEDHNLLVFQFDNDGAHTEALIDLANTIADLRHDGVKTVAFVERHARGAAGLLALACDEVYMSAEGIIGGYGSSDAPGDLTFEMQQTLEALGHSSLREWSLFYGCLDPTVELHVYTQAESGEVRAFCQQQFDALEDQQKWSRGALLNTERHFDHSTLRQVGHLQGIAEDLPALLANFDLQPSDVEVKTTTGLSGFLNEIAHSNWFLWATLTMAIYGLMAELASPGLGIPGLLSLLGFGLHIWARHLNGTVAALEIILIVIGVIGIGVELFVTPGFGFFGIGGACSLLLGLILSAQSFSFPSNPFQVSQLANSITGVIGTSLAALVLYQMTIRTFGDTWLGCMIAPANSDATTAQQTRWNEALVHWEHLVGQSGQTTTRLSPAGKAHIDSRVYDVVSDGEMIETGIEINVIEVTGNRIVVTKS